jgi:membrane-bound lytic murein transglycosylase D
LDINLKVSHFLIYTVATGLLIGCGHFSKTSTSAPQSDAEQRVAGQTAPNHTPSDTGMIQPGIDVAATDGIPGELANEALPSNDDTALTDPNLETGNDDNASGKGGQLFLDEALGLCEVAQSFWQKGELENALEALDKAYSLIIEVDSQQDAKLIQQKEDLRFLISKRILEIYASRNIVVNGGFHEIPMAMNQHVQNEIARFTGIERSFFSESYQRSGFYQPYILEALKKEGMPEELAWLPLIESGFKVKALSSARALGLWQFIPSTGYKFGLKRDRYVDERLDFIKATDAAIAYLKELHSIFGDWATALAAYNCGEGRVLKVIRTQNINYLDNFWDLYQRLPLETARYVPRFFATLHIIHSPEKYGFNDLITDPPLDYETVTISRQAQLKDISQTTGVDLAALRLLNPELRYQILPPESYNLRIPKGSQEQLMAGLDAIPISQLPQRSYVRHKVRTGQTLSTIARKYHTSVRNIMRANNMRNTRIRAGKTLKIPQRGYVTPTHVAASQPVSTPASGVHRVHKGDSLWIIANRYGTTVAQIKELNDLSSNHLHIGQSLKIPGFKPEPLPDTSQLNTYDVQTGDSPFTIAQKSNMSLERLLRINQLTPRSKIYPGQKLYIE